MTRVNIVPPSELTDQHLFSEFREIKMVPKSLARSIKARGLHGIKKIVPSQFTLNTGHVCFFYDKGEYLRERYEQIKDELRKRKINFDEGSIFDPDSVYSTNLELNNGYTPTEQDLSIIRERISHRISLKPKWYRYYGKPIG